MGRLGTIVAQAAIELREVRRVVAPRGIGSVETRLDRGGEEAENDRSEGDEQRDNELNEAITPASDASRTGGSG